MLKFIASFTASSPSVLIEPLPGELPIRPKITKGSPVRAGGGSALRYIELAPFHTISLDIAADCTWRPGPASVKVIASEAFLKTFHLAIAGEHLSLHCSATLIGERPRFEFQSKSLNEVHLAGETVMEAEDLIISQLISTARGASTFRVAGEANEAHFEVQEQGVIDAASLSTRIAAADLRDKGMIFLKVKDAIEADLRGDSQLLTIGSPKILDARRHQS